MPTVRLEPTKDADIANHSRSSNGYYIYQSGKRSDLTLGCWDWETQPWTSYYAYQSRILLHYNMPQLPPGAVLTSAKLKMYLVKDESMHSWNSGSYSYNHNPTLNVHRLLQGWEEGSGNGKTYNSNGVTWSYRGSSQGYWSSLGGSFDQTPSAIKTETWDTHWWEFDVKSLVEYWMANPTQNFGLLVKYANDHQLQGSLWTSSREGGWSVPYIELTYSTPPDKPRGMSPNFDSFVCYDLSHTTHFKWKFIDTATPPVRGRSDIVFLIDTTGSMRWNLSSIRSNIATYIDRMTKEGIDWQVGLVNFGDHRLGDPIRKYGFYKTKNEVLAAFNSMPMLRDGDWPESGLEAICDPTNGALSFPFRNPTKIQFIICTDAPFYNKEGIDTGYYSNSSIYSFNTVVADLKARGIKVSVNANTHCASYTQLHQLPYQTGGFYNDENAGWGNQISLDAAPFEDEPQRYDEGDYQTRADLRIFKIETNGARTQIWSYTVWGSQQELRVKELGVPWEEGCSYEWDVMVYDSVGLPSPWSDRAKMTYIIDVSALVGIPMYLEPLKVGETINKKALIEFRGKLYDEVKKYRDLDPAEVLQLFNGEVVPSKDDMNRLKSIMNRMLTNDGMSPFWDDLIPDGVLGISDINRIRTRLVEVSYSPPDNPPGGYANRSIGQVQRPVGIVSNNTNSYDTTIDVKWTPAEFMGAGWQVRLNPSQDTDINYYKLFHEQLVNYGVAPLRMITEVYLKSEQIQHGTIFIPDTGRTDWERMWYTAHDMNGRSSWTSGTVALNYGTVVGTPPLTVSYYVVEYQQKAWSALKPDPNGAWYNIYSGGNTSFTHTVSSEGSYWYRVKAVDQWGISTDWTYSVDTTYIKY